MAPEEYIEVRTGDRFAIYNEERSGAIATSFDQKPDDKCFRHDVTDVSLVEPGLRVRFDMMPMPYRFAAKMYYDPGKHYNDVIMGVMASQITGVAIELNCWLRRRSKKISKFHVTGLCARNSPVTGEFSAQKASNAENVSF